MKRGIKFLGLACIAVAMMTSCNSSKEQTIANLQIAIDGESTASAKYAAFATRAQEDSLFNVAALFNATSAAEAIHVKNHIAVLAELGVTDYTPVIGEIVVDSTAANLATAISGEKYEFETMYPEFNKAANAENVLSAVVSFNFALNTEKGHAVIYQHTLNYLMQGSNPNDSTLSVYYVCPKCGNVYTGTPADVCELCQTGSADFIVFEAQMPTTVIAAVIEK